MAAPSSTPLSLILSLLLLISQTRALTAPAPGPASPPNITGILDKAGQYTTLIRLLKTTQTADQISTQINNSADGMTVLAPTDNAFNNLPAGALNGLSGQEQVSLLQYHVLPKFYSLADLLTVSNPVKTQASGQDGPFVGLNFIGQGNQVNVSTGVVETPVNNALAKDKPLAVYQVDKVLLPPELFGTKPPSAAPAPTKKPSGDSNTTSTAAAAAPSVTADDSGSVRIGNVGLGLAGLLFMAALS